MNHRRGIGLLLALSVFLLAGCETSDSGGGSGGPSPQSEMNGIWSGYTVATGRTEHNPIDGMIFDGKVYFGIESGAIVGSVDASGGEFDLQFTVEMPRDGTIDITMNGNYTEKEMASGTFTVSNGESGDIFLFYHLSSNTAASADRVTGNWVSDEWTLAVDGTGNFTATNSSGCTEEGTIKPASTTQNIYSMSYTETCSTGTSTFEGLANVQSDAQVNSDPDNTLVIFAGSDAAGISLRLTRQ